MLKIAELCLLTNKVSVFALLKRPHATFARITHKVKNIMKLQVLFSAAVTAVTISKPHANNFLQRFRRANEGYFSELTSGNLERECVEETCDQTEFYEVYDDDAVSAPLYTVYLDCKNYIRWDKDDQLSINSLRDCLIEGKHNNGQQATQGNDQVTQKPMTPKSTQQGLPDNMQGF